MGYASCKPADALVCVVPDGCLLALVSLLLAKRLAGKNFFQNDLFCVEWDVKTNSKSKSVS